MLTQFTVLLGILGFSILKVSVFGGVALEWQSIIIKICGFIITEILFIGFYDYLGTFCEGAF